MKERTKTCCKMKLPLKFHRPLPQDSRTASEEHPTRHQRLSGWPSEGPPGFAYLASPGKEAYKATQSVVLGEIHALSAPKCS